MHRRLLALLTAVPLLAASVQPAAAAVPVRYVALGDSFAAGYGVAPAAPAAPPGCGRSARDYPQQAATALGAQLVDVTCSGATTADMTAPQSTAGASVGPQFDALTAGTGLVTLTIGGNDLGFGAIAAACTSPWGPNGPVLAGGPDCTAHYTSDGTDQLITRIDNVVAPAVHAVLAGIKQRAPHAKIVVVDYLALTPDPAHTPAGGCWINPLQTADGLPLTTADLPYLYRVQAHLDQTLVAQAAAAHAAVARVFPASVAHTACSASPWTNGITLAGLTIAPGSLHPNLTGVTELATRTTAIARAVLAGQVVTVPTLPGTAGGISAASVALVSVVAVVIIVVAVGIIRVQRRRRIRV